jgi:hypothetical protein
MRIQSSAVCVCVHESNVCVRVHTVVGVYASDVYVCVCVYIQLWVLAAKLEVRCKRLDAARRILGLAIGMAPKDKTFKAYIELEMQLGSFDRYARTHTHKQRDARTRGRTPIPHSSPTHTHTHTHTN